MRSIFKQIVDVNNTNATMKKKQRKSSNFKLDVTILCIAMFICIVTIYLSFLVILKQWNPNNLQLVDPRECKCDCWDGAYRGPNIRRDFLSLDHKTSEYKFVYFNLERQTLYICFLAILYIHLFMVSITGFIYNLIFSFKSIRFEMVFLFICSYYSNFYSFWATFNYLNDVTGSKYFFAQIYYGMTELCLAYIAYQLHATKKKRQI